MEYQDLFSLKNNNNKKKNSSAAVVISASRVNHYCLVSCLTDDLHKMKSYFLENANKLKCCL